MGDFNKRYAVDYVHRCLLDDFDVSLSNFGFEQLIDFVTWSRLVVVTLIVKIPFQLILCAN